MTTRATGATPPHAAPHCERHPAALPMLFFTEMWERFSYYGIRALLGNIRFEDGAGQFIAPWMSIADEARREVAATHAAEGADARATACEQAAVRISIRNLMTFPFVQEAVAAGRLQLHGWYFDLNGGELLGYDPATGGFELFVKGVAEQPASQHTTLP